MNFLEKIKWRIDFLLHESKGKNLNAVFFNLLSSKSNLKGELLCKTIEKSGLIKIEEYSKEKLLFDFGLVKLYSKKLSLWALFHDYLGLIYPYLTKKEQACFSYKSFFSKKEVKEIEGPYETDGVNLNEGDYVIDAGANIGMFSIFASSKIGEKGKIFAFEPIPEAQELLRENIELNKSKNIKVIPFALGESKKELEFFLSPNNIEASSGYFDRGGGRTKIRQISLDRFVEENKISKINFIKADIEGMERNFLIGAEETIKRFKPKIAICIYHRPDDPMVLERMIKEFVPEYRIVKTEKKLYAWVEK